MSRKDVLARRYAEGLLDNARDAGERERVRGDLVRLREMLDPAAKLTAAREFRACLASPALPAADKLRVAEEVLPRIGVGGEVSAFLAVLIRRGRLEILPEVALAFEELADQAEGRLTAMVHTARPLDDRQRERLSGALSRALGRQVSLHQVVEPRLLAGARISVGDKTFDGSALGGLERLKGRLLSALAR